MPPMRLLAALVLLLVSACGRSPTSPSAKEVSVSGDMTWIDPSGTRLMLQVSGDKIYRFVTLTPGTHVAGVIASAGQLVASYRGGNRIWVRAIGTETDPTSDVAATTVIPAPQPATLRSVRKTPIVYHPERPYWTMTWGNAVLIVMPWTTIEPGGDITTYDAFLALAAPSGSIVDLEGEGWIVGNNVTHMRGVKLTRRTQ